jgi:hypothetical protein
MAECKGCGKTICWGVDENGKRIPLDPVPPCYEADPACQAGSGKCKRRHDVMVSHFATCKKANEFSGSKKK